MKKINIYIKFLLIFVVLGVLIYLILSNEPNYLRKIFQVGSNKIDSIKNDFSNNLKDEFDWEIPDLPEGFSWEEYKATEDELTYGQMFFDNRFANVKPEDSISGGILPKSGDIYKTSVEIDSSYSDVWNIVDKFKENIDLPDTDKGWFGSVTLGDYSIAGIAADGPIGSLWGYVKINDFIIRTVSYGYDISANLTSSDDEPMTFECPCKVDLWVFVSGPVDIRDSINNL